jgi:hypothetical protein
MNNTNQNRVAKKSGSLQGRNDVTEPKPKTIKLGIDVHLDRYLVVRTIKGSTHSLVRYIG